MTKQYIWALAIAGAFVAGTILASTMYDNTAFAIHQPNHNPPGDDDDMGWKQAVAEQQQQIDEQQQQIDDLKTNEILGFYQVIGDSTVISPLSSRTGTASCDDSDIAISGGWDKIGGDMRIIFSVQTSINEWGLIFESIDDTNSVEVFPFALCADFSPAHIDPE